VQQRQMWDGGPAVGAIGLGCMGASWGYQESARDDEASVTVLRRAVAAGATLVDTSDVYGDGHNEQLVARALAGQRDQVVLATKGGLVVDDLATRRMHRDGSPSHLRAAVDASLHRLNTDVIDLYYLHRVDPAVPLTESWSALAELVTAGKIRGLALSEVSVAELTAAHRIHPVRAVQSELSLWTRDPLRAGPHQQPSVLDWCAANGAAFVPFAPLGRGFLTGQIVRHDQLEPVDFRAGNPRFQPEALTANQAILATVRAVAERHDATPAQVAIAWTLAQGPHVVPIPGTRSEHHLQENLGAANLRLAPDDLTELDHLPAPVGSRY
jgi:aryl-alcohol dehydrogenase-like predicted oxidoreductase